jgi:hypothetical protein
MENTDIHRQLKLWLCTRLEAKMAAASGIAARSYIAEVDPREALALVIKAGRARY